MSAEPFLHCDAMRDMGVEHGLGTRASQDAEVADVTFVRQVHGTRCLRVPAAMADAQADALFTTQPGLAVGVRTADCVPLLLVDVHFRAVAAVHAGWRGSAAGIAERTVVDLAADLGVQPADWIVAIGPHIGSCCYEVDRPVRDAIRDPEVLRPGSRPGHYDLDLLALNTLQLVRAGVQPENIHPVGGCTHCHSKVYASYRHDRTAERMVHYVRMPAPRAAGPSGI